MAGKNLLDKRAAGAGHAEDEDRQAGGIARVGHSLQQAGVKNLPDSLNEPGVVRRVVTALVSLQFVAREPLRKGAIVLADVVQRFAQRGMNVEHRAGRQPVATGGQGFERPEVGLAGTEGFQRRAIVMCFGKIGFQGDCPLEASPGPLEFAQTFERFAQGIVRFRDVWFEGQGLLVVCNGLVESVQPTCQIAEVDVPLGKAWPQARRLVRNASVPRETCPGSIARCPDRCALRPARERSPASCDMPPRLRSADRRRARRGQEPPALPVGPPIRAAG